FENAFTYLDEQIGFRLINQFLNILGFNYVGAFMMYSLIFMICAFVLLRAFEKKAIYMHILLLPAILLFVNYAIRQGFAFSLLLLALYFFYKKKFSVVFLLLIASSFIHSAVLITAVMIGAIFILFD